MTDRLTGFFFEAPYTEGCATLVEQIDLLSAAISGGADKLRGCADSYEQSDLDAQGDFNGLAAETGG